MEYSTAGLHTIEISKNDSHYDYRAFYQISKHTSEKLHGTIAIGNSHTGATKKERKNIRPKKFEQRMFLMPVASRG